LDLDSLKEEAPQNALARLGSFLQTVEVQEPDLIETDNFVGVDCGHLYHRLLSRWRQDTTIPRQPGSASPTPLLSPASRTSTPQHSVPRRRVRKKLRDREARIVRTLNHLISRRIVEQAKRTKATIVLEDLEGIRAGLGVSQGQRYERFSWSYFQLQQMILYKAKLAGIPILFVLRLTPARPVLDASSVVEAIVGTGLVVCQECGFAYPADDNAAMNIRFLGGSQPPRSAPSRWRSSSIEIVASRPGFSRVVTTGDSILSWRFQQAGRGADAISGSIHENDLNGAATGLASSIPRCPTVCAGGQREDADDRVSPTEPPNHP